MKKIFKYSLLLLAAGLVFTACKDDNEAGKLDPVVLSGPQTYFNNEMDDVIEISKEESSFTVTINRQNAEGEVTVPIKATMPEGSIYTVPATVTFPAGATSADIVITYDPEELEYGDYTDITLTIGDENVTSPYGLSTYTFSVGATEWEDYGVAYYREALIKDWGFNIDNLIYQVPIQRSVTREGVYRLVNPYGAPFPYNEPGDYDAATDSYMVIDASDPEYVWIDGFTTSTNWGYGNFTFYSLVYYYYRSGQKTLEALKAANPEYFGTLEDGIISMPAKSFLGSMSEFQGGGLFPDFNTTGEFGIALPGYRFADYSIKYQMTGRFIDLDDNLYVEGVATLGDDVASAIAVLVTEDNFQEIYEAIISGQEVEGAVEIASKETFRLPFTESGTYYVMILAFDKNGEEVQNSFSRVKLSNPTEGAGVNWEAQFTGSYMYELFSEPGDPDIDEGVILSTDAANPNHLMLSPWMDESHQLEFTVVDETGTIVVPEQGTGFDYDGELFVMDVATFTNGNPEYADKVCKFEGTTITLNLVYYNDQHTLLCSDTYTITGEAGAKQKVKFTSRKITKKIDTKQSVSLRRFKKISKPTLKKRRK